MEFSPDPPIELPGQDRLGRRHFTEALAKAIRNWHRNESLVIGLFGGWGSGKSSIKNLVVHSLCHRRQSTPLIIHFNPWLVSRQEQLVEAFFREISIAISRPIPGQSEKESAERLAKLATYFSMFGTATEHTMDVLAIAGVPGAAVGAKIAKGLNNASERAKKGAEAQKGLAEAATKTLSELKEELRKSLSERKDPILVIVDDIDRLTNDEICLLFRLIKANADFPKFVYLLLCDRLFVTSALESLAPKRGAEFLEKIVQIGFDLPEPNWDDLVKIAWAEWDSLSKSSPDAARRTELIRWNRVMLLSRPYLRHIRAVRRWMNAVRFSFGFFKKGRGFDANPEDFLALELLRLHEPALYERLSCSKTELTRPRLDLLYQRKGAEGTRAAVKASILETVEENRRGNAEHLADWLFPNAAWSSFATDSSALLRELRVADARCFDRYFNFIINKETLSRAEIQNAIAATAAAQIFASLIRRELARGRLSVLFDHLSAHSADLCPNAAAILDGMFEVGDELPDQKWIFGGSGLQEEATHFLIALVSNIPEIATRSSLLRATIARATGIMLPVFVSLYEISAAYRKITSEDSRLTPDERLPELKAALLAKIREFKDTPIFRDAEQIGAALAAWRFCGGASEAGDWMREQLRTPKGTLQMLKSAAGVMVSGGTHEYISVDANFLWETAGRDLVDAAVSGFHWSEVDAQDQKLKELYESTKRTANDEKGQ